MNATVIHLGLPRRRENIEVRRERTRNVLLDHNHLRVHVLNDTAFALWQLCDGETTPEEMVESCCTLFAAQRSTVVHDVQRTLDELTRADLIEWRFRPEVLQA